MVEYVEPTGQWGAGMWGQVRMCGGEDEGFRAWVEASMILKGREDGVPRKTASRHLPFSFGIVGRPRGPGERPGLWWETWGAWVTALQHPARKRFPRSVGPVRVADYLVRPEVSQVVSHV